ncbi:MAG: hypothetical protein JW997_06460, partial [Actinobacteria bacterium]|nr:hypothetical protein [Actinomycetota bacterium]
MDFNRRFDYIIPPNLAGRIKTGSIVAIPLKNRIETGYVCRIKKYSYVKDASLKFIAYIFGDIEVFDISRLKLIHWMCANYIQPFGKIAELFLPPVEKTKLMNILKNPEKYLAYCSILSIDKLLLEDFEKKSVSKKFFKQKLIIDFIKSCG